MRFGHDCGQLPLIVFLELVEFYIVAQVKDCPIKNQQLLQKC